MIAKRHKKSKCPDSDMIVLTIMGEPASKANARRLVKIKKRYAFIKSKKALSYSRNLKYSALYLTLCMKKISLLR